jgi:hypothetical protein
VVRTVGRRGIPVLVLLASVALVGASAGCGPDDDPGGSRPTGLAPVDLTRSALWLSFDDDVTADGAPGYADAAGGPSIGLVSSANGGGVEQVPGADGTGSAVAFPPKCPAQTDCPRAMVEVLSDPSLDPGTHDFEYGAAVWLAPDQTTSGSNIIQKGRFATEGGQWKLQVDDQQGFPSCVVRSSEPGAQPVEVKSKVTIADSTWHRVACRKDQHGLTIVVDGTAAERDAQIGAVTSEWPVRIGAPGVKDGDDQFHGRVDDVYLIIDSDR